MTVETLVHEIPQGERICTRCGREVPAGMYGRVVTVSGGKGAGRFTNWWPWQRPETLAKFPGCQKMP